MADATAPQHLRSIAIRRYEQSKTTAASIASRRYEQSKTTDASIASCRYQQSKTADARIATDHRYDRRCKHSKTSKVSIAVDRRSKHSRTAGANRARPYT